MVSLPMALGLWKGRTSYGKRCSSLMTTRKQRKRRGRVPSIPFKDMSPRDFHKATSLEDSTMYWRPNLLTCGPLRDPYPKHNKLH